MESFKNSQPKNIVSSPSSLGQRKAFSQLAGDPAETWLSWMRRAVTAFFAIGDKH